MKFTVTDPMVLRTWRPSDGIRVALSGWCCVVDGENPGGPPLEAREKLIGARQRFPKAGIFRNLDDGIVTARLWYNTSPNEV